MDISSSFFSQLSILHFTWQEKHFEGWISLEKKTFYQILILLPADFRKFAKNFGQRCQNCNQRAQCVFFSYFLRNSVWSALDLSEEKFGLERVAFLHGYENSNQCFHSNFLRNNLWEHSKLQLIERCVLIKNQNFPETCWSLWVGFPNLHLTCPVQPIQFFWVDSVFYCFLDSEWK